MLLNVGVAKAGYIHALVSILATVVTLLVPDAPRTDYVFLGTEAPKSARGR